MPLYKPDRGVSAARAMDDTEIVLPVTLHVQATQPSAAEEGGRMLFTERVLVISC